MDLLDRTVVALLVLAVVAGVSQARDLPVNGAQYENVDSVASSDTDLDNTELQACLDDDSCPSGMFCYTQTGTCEPCDAFSSSMEEAPQRCKDFAVILKTDPDTLDVDPRCKVETDCPSGQWCLLSVGTCEFCEVLDPEDQKKYCAGWTTSESHQDSLEQKEETDQTTMRWAVGLAVATFVIMVAVVLGIYYWHQSHLKAFRLTHKTVTHPQEDNEDGDNDMQMIVLDDV